ncbi:MAG TPA: hypothetical protein VF581_12485 [Flavobacterium sp.]|jgi:hypothetical protein
MHLLKRLFDFYLQASIHVAFAVYSLVRMTQHQFDIDNGQHVGWFAFFGTVAGYNFVKYDALARVRKAPISPKLRLIAIVSFFSFLLCGWFFLQLSITTKIVAAAVLFLTMLYTLPFFPNRRNARNWAGFKIYIVACCWVGVTLFLPVLDGGLSLTADFSLKCIQRFLLVFILILIFEIIDLAKDDPHLQTVPQQIGVKRTKIVGTLLLTPFYLLEFLNSQTNSAQLLVNLVIILIIAAFLWNANERRSSYYSAFWAEAIPILWLILVLML